MFKIEKLLSIMFFFVDNYNNDQECQLTLRAPEHFVLFIVFEEFQLSNGDFLTFYDGPNASSPLIESRSGENTESIFSSENAMVRGCVFLRAGEVVEKHRGQHKQGD